MRNELGIVTFRSISRRFLEPNISRIDVSRTLFLQIPSPHTSPGFVAREARCRAQLWDPSDPRRLRVHF